MDQLIGKTLGNRYEILERIGTGGMAVVYKVTRFTFDFALAFAFIDAGSLHDPFDAQLEQS